MRLTKYFNFKKKSADIAKDRLKIIIEQERKELDSPDFLPLLRKDILEAIGKYVSINVDDVKVDLQCRDNNAVLELNISLPERS